VCGPAPHGHVLEAMQVMLSDPNNVRVRTRRLSQGNVQLALDDQTTMERVPSAALLRAHENLAAPRCSGPMAAAVP
jgi:hypothetical protein